MNTITATYAKQNFGTCIADAIKQPLLIEKSGRPSVVMLSYEEFQRLSDAQDAIWIQRANEAAAGGYLSADEADTFFHKKLQHITNSL